MNPKMTPAPGEHLLRFVGDRLSFRLDPGEGGPGVRAFLRTNLTRARVARAEVCARARVRLAGQAPFAGASWRDIPFDRTSSAFELDLPLLEVGHFQAKAYLVDSRGRQHWPDGPDVGVSVHPDALRTANLVYCAFPREFGTSNRAIPDAAADAVRLLDDGGFTVIPPSGKIRDLTRAVPHIMGTLGFRMLHLLPIGPVPTTHARMGRYGSPYAQLDLTGIDPALVEHDRLTTGVQQLRELTDTVHACGGFVLLDVVLNHTGWASRLFEQHPRWFVRNADGTFKSPGAWGNTWEDLVELDHRHLPLWHELAESLVTWCRRGIDGFRCDAGYMVPLPAWQFVIARVREEYPECIFLLEGLGGPWESTETLLTVGGMQWAYSELFQNYSGKEVAAYLDHCRRHSGRIGLLVHYAETHDNDRLAKKGRTWSLLRNRLCALASDSGAYAITAGVEWLETSKIDVHEPRSLGFGRTPNLVPEIARLTRLLADHPCFFEGAVTTRLGPAEGSVLVLERRSRSGSDHCLVLANLDPGEPASVEMDAEAWLRGGEKTVDLLGGRVPEVEWKTPERIRTVLGPGEVVCLSDAEHAHGLFGDAYRKRRAVAAWALTAIGAVLPHEEIGPADFEELAEEVTADPAAFLGSLGRVQPARAKHDLLAALRAAAHERGYPEVVTWTSLDARRVLLLPPGHWLLVSDPKAFDVELELPGIARRIRSVETDSGHVVAIPPVVEAFDFAFRFDQYESHVSPVEGRVRALPASGAAALGSGGAAERVLLTNGRGGMARMSVDLGKVTSKYDCLLAANLHPSAPSDRHVFVKRLRAWVNADGFITPLDGENRLEVHAGPPARFRFAAHAGDGRHVRIDVDVDFLDGQNTVIVRCARPEDDARDTLPPDHEVRITLRLDLEDRSYHSETHASAEVDAHFTGHTRELAGVAGFEFTPAVDRRLTAAVDRGSYHPAPEWSIGLFHEEESTRGLMDRGDGWSPGWFDASLARGEEVRLCVSAEPDSPLRFEIEPEPAEPPLEPYVRALRHAARAFVVRRGTGKTVIAGYPWFLDWGRDSLIAARGLLAGGFVEEVRSILHTFARFEEGGTLPNFLVGDEAGSRESSDAPLWFALACDEYARKVGDGALHELALGERSLAEVLASIASHYLAGTQNGVVVDGASGLVWSPPHFTWMDTNHPAATPREGYPIELAALFARLTALLGRLGATASGTSWMDLSARTRDAIASLYYDDHLGFAADTLHAPRGTPAAEARRDDHLRPNQLFAVSLGVLTGDRARSIVRSAERYLLVPGALRTLAPRHVEVPLPVARDGVLLNDPGYPYWGRYEGDEDTRRKPAYHNGTAWPWLLPTYAEALVLAWPGDARARRAARAIVGSTAALLSDGTAGQIPEILDGDAPHRHRGCDAQAWSVTETLRVAAWLEEAS
jgi:glycogen debranching enzyme